jgi:hypothetical protein
LTSSQIQLKLGDKRSIEKEIEKNRSLLNPVKRKIAPKIRQYVDTYEQINNDPNYKEKIVSAQELFRVNFVLNKINANYKRSIQSNPVKKIDIDKLTDSQVKDRRNMLEDLDYAVSNEMKAYIENN